LLTVVRKLAAMHAWAVTRNGVIVDLSSKDALAHVAASIVREHADAFATLTYHYNAHGALMLEGNQNRVSYHLTQMLKAR